MQVQRPVIIAFDAPIIVIAALSALTLRARANSAAITILSGPIAIIFAKKNNYVN